MLGKIKGHLKRNRAMVARQEELAFKAKMNGIKRDFDKGIGNLEKLRDDRAKKAIQAKEQKNDVAAKNYKREYKDAEKYLAKLTDMRSRVEYYTSRLEIAKAVAGTVGGLQTISEEIAKVAGKIDFSGAYVDMGSAVDAFSMIDERLDSLFGELDEMFTMDDDTADSDDDDDDDTWAAMRSIATPKKDVAKSASSEKQREADEDARRLEEIDRLSQAD